MNDQTKTDHKHLTLLVSLEASMAFWHEFQRLVKAVHHAEARGDIDQVNALGAQIGALRDPDAMSEGTGTS
jgi:hypothetical protein